MRVLPGDLVHAFEDAFLGLDDGGAFLEKSIILGAITAGYPAIQNKGNTSVGRDPFAVVAPCKVQVGGIRNAALTGWMADVLSGIQIGAWLYTLI